jgi:cytochrome oxidase Cu insertion factor (SCO1/SenC/PrrC family)
MKRGVITPLLFAASALAASLGPKDGRELPPADLNRIQIGQAAPDFTLDSLDGRPITLSDFRGKGRVVLVFYRGHW